MRVHTYDETAPFNPQLFHDALIAQIGLMANAFGPNYVSKEELKAREAHKLIQQRNYKRERAKPKGTDKTAHWKNKRIGERSY